MADQTEDAPDDREALFDRLRKNMLAGDAEPAADAAAIVGRFGAGGPDDSAVEAAPADAPSRPRRLAATYKDRRPSVRVALTWPIVLEGRPLSEVSLWPPVHDDVEAVLTGRMARAEMVANMARLPDGFLSCLRFPDSDLVVSVAMVLAPDLFEAR